MPSKSSQLIKRAMESCPLIVSKLYFLKPKALKFLENNCNSMRSLVFGYYNCSFLAPFIDVSFPSLALVSFTLANRSKDYFKCLILHL